MGVSQAGMGKEMSQYTIRDVEERLAFIHKSPNKQVQVWVRETQLTMGRASRLSVVQHHYNLGNLTEEKAIEALKDQIDPEDPSSAFDDSMFLEKVKIEHEN